MENIRGQKAIITGASRGIGQAVALGLAESGVDVALLGRDENELLATQKLCKEHGVQALTLTIDLLNTEEIEKTIRSAVKNLGGIDILVNSAGAIHISPVQDADTKKWDQILDLNVKSLMHISRHVVPHLIKQNSGTIINIASSAAKSTFPQFGAYCASKHAVLGFSGCLFEDVREHEIKVTTICPGFVNTKMASGFGLNPERMIQPSDISDAVNFVAGFPGTGCPTEITIKPQRVPKFDE